MWLDPYLFENDLSVHFARRPGGRLGLLLGNTSSWRSCRAFLVGVVGGGTGGGNLAAPIGQGHERGTARLRTTI